MQYNKKLPRPVGLQLYFIQDNTFTIKYSIIIIAIIIVVVSELGTVKKGKLENIKKVSERATVKRPK